jgi:hypothetical protein
MPQITKDYLLNKIQGLKMQGVSAQQMSSQKRDEAIMCEGLIQGLEEQLRYMEGPEPGKKAIKDKGATDSISKDVPDSKGSEDANVSQIKKVAKG